MSLSETAKTCLTRFGRDHASLPFEIVRGDPRRLIALMGRAATTAREKELVEEIDANMEEALQIISGAMGLV